MSVTFPTGFSGIVEHEECLVAADRTRTELDESRARITDVLAAEADEQSSGGPKFAQTLYADAMHAGYTVGRLALGRRTVRTLVVRRAGSRDGYTSQAGT